MTYPYHENCSYNRKRNVKHRFTSMIAHIDIMIFETPLRYGKKRNF
jgi:hypothetical protein